MSPDQLKAKFPNASEAFLRRNAKTDYACSLDYQETKPSKKRLRQSSKGPNKWEREFADHLQADGNTVYPATVKLRIANGVWYMPDILAVVGTCVTFYEVKGFMRDDAAVKLKVAANTYPCFRFVLAWKDKGVWREQRIIP